MKRSDTALKRAIERAWDEPAAVPSATIANIYVAMLSFVRREKAKAWMQGFVHCLKESANVHDNPYRGRSRR